MRIELVVLDGARATIYAITAAIYRPPIHATDTVVVVGARWLSTLRASSLRPSPKPDTLRLTNNSHCRCVALRRRWIYGRRAASRPRASHTIETIGAGRRAGMRAPEVARSIIFRQRRQRRPGRADARRIRYIESGGGRAGAGASNIGRFIIPRRRLRRRRRAADKARGTVGRRRRRAERSN